jgi:hypothetical protein
MLIKRAKDFDASRTFRRLSARRWLLIIVSLCLLICIVLGSIYYGMVLVKTGQSISMSDWGKGIARAKLSVISNYFDGLTAKPEHIELDIKFKDVQKLEYKRQQALTEGNLISEDDDWVPATIQYNGEEYKADVRLKGDVSDHWRRADQWSYKVKMKGDHALFGMKRFAIQDPRTRNHMNEWLIHKLLARLDLISLRYDFIDVTINGKHQPIYAIEENFEKRLVEHNERREGPIMRYDQWFYWLDRAGLSPELAGASVSTYEEGRYTGEGRFAYEFELARSLLDLYRRGELPASKVFDVRRLARLFALTDLTGHFHATAIDNLKFYYNPVTSLIEPVGYDFNEFLPLVHAEGGISAEQLMPKQGADRDPMDWRSGLFLDREFYKQYIEALQMISDKKFLDDFFASVQDEFNDKMSILHSSYPWYKNQEYIRALLNPARTLQVYFHSVDSTARQAVLQIHNIHVLPAELLYLSYGDSLRILPVSNEPIPGYADDEPIRYTEARFALPVGMDASMLTATGWTLTYQILGTSNPRTEAVYPWPAVNDQSLAGDFLRRDPNAKDFDWIRFNEADKTITILPGKYVPAESIVFPTGYTVRASGGTEIDLKNGAVILTHSPLYWIGDEENRIKIFSSDSTGQGLAVLSEGKRSTLSYVEFDHLSNPKKDSWALTGCVTFYESPTTLSHCRFSNNHSEDCLNIVRSEFILEHSTFANTYADAFDSDFAKGSYDDMDFFNCGNDCVDISGTEITSMTNIRIDGAGDKGISVGEISHIVNANGVTIQNTEIAVASKDLSTVEMENLVVKDCKVVFTIYQKKPEFGPGWLQVTGLQATGTEKQFLLEKGSTLIIDGKPMEANEEDIKDILYGVQYGKASNR